MKDVLLLDALVVALVVLVALKALFHYISEKHAGGLVITPIDTAYHLSADGWVTARPALDSIPDEYFGADIVCDQREYHFSVNKPEILAHPTPAVVRKIIAEFKRRGLVVDTVTVKIHKARHNVRFQANAFA